MPARRFPPPWTIAEANNACFIVRDSTGPALGGQAIHQVEARADGGQLRQTAGAPGRAAN